MFLDLGIIILSSYVQLYVSSGYGNDNLSGEKDL
jgi:hypothetical protein